VRVFRKFLAAAPLVLVGSFCHQTAAEIELPVLGDTSSGMISPAQERQLGQNWLRLYRSQVPTSSDPFVIEYLENLLARLVPYSQLEDKHVELVVVENSTLNAFAVPGGIIGVHTGLLGYAKTENQLATVLAHELAHLSQRHYARRLEQQKNMAVPFYTAMLASLVLLATSSSHNNDAGMAALATTQALALDAQLRFSRQNEQEADRIGMQTMVQAGLDPYAAAEMFEEMLRGSRYGRRPPEFLLTHPVSESRVADAYNRAMQYPRKPQADNPEYQLMRARIRAASEETPQQAIRRFKGELDGDTQSRYASRYGLTLAYLLAHEYDNAREALAPLLEQEPDRLTYQIMASDIEVAAGNYQDGIATLEALLERHPDSHPARIRYAEALMKAGQYQRSAEVLERYSRQRPNDDYVWYLLAEVNGLAGNILGVHEARAEYFILNGIFDRAQIQLLNALKHAEGNHYRTAILQERIKYVEHQQQRLAN
jgi:predicted Zn-dependent protease